MMEKHKKTHCVLKGKDDANVHVWRVKLQNKFHCVFYMYTNKHRYSGQTLTRDICDMLFVVFGFAGFSIPHYTVFYRRRAKVYCCLVLKYMRCEVYRLIGFSFSATKSFFMCQF